VWSFGVTAIEVLTRRNPYPQLTIGLIFQCQKCIHTNCDCTDQFSRDYMNQMASISTHIPKDTPPDLQNIIAACFTWDPQSRISFAMICDRLESSAALSAYFKY
jgi:serine/threonine protein kinase